MYIIPIAKDNTSNCYFRSTNKYNPPLAPYEGVYEITLLLNSGLARISPCTDEYEGQAVLSAAVPEDPKLAKSYYAFLGPEKIFWALMQDVRKYGKVNEEILRDVFLGV